MVLGEPVGIPTNIATVVDVTSQANTARIVAAEAAEVRRGIRP